MKTINFFRKPILAIAFASTILFISCSQTGTFEDQNITNQNLSIVKREVNESDVSKFLELEKYAFSNEAENLDNFTIFKNFLAKNNVSINYIGFADENSLKAVMTNSLQENINIALNSGNFTDREIVEIEKFIANITDENSDRIYSDVLKEFETSISNLNLSKDRLAFYDSYFTALKILAKAHPEIYNYSTTVQNANRCSLWDHGSLALAFIGLATLEVGSGGMATGVAVAGWLYASASWGRACA